MPARNALSVALASVFGAAASGSITPLSSHRAAVPPHPQLPAHTNDWTAFPRAIWHCVSNFGAQGIRMLRLLEDLACRLIRGSLIQVKRTNFVDVS